MPFPILNAHTGKTSFHDSEEARSPQIISVPRRSALQISFYG